MRGDAIDDSVYQAATDGRTIYGQLYTGGGVTLVFTDPGVINPVHTPRALRSMPRPRRI